MLLAGYPLHKQNRENGKKNPCQGKHREFGNFAKIQGIWFAVKVVNSLILKVKDISIFAAKISNFFLNWISLLSQGCVCNSHKSRKLAQAKFAVGQGKIRENTGNLKMQFEWVPCAGKRR